MREDELDRLAFNLVNTVITEYGSNLINGDISKVAKYVSAARLILKEEGADDNCLVSEQNLTVMALKITLAVMRSCGVLGNCGLALTHEDLAASPYKRKCVKAAYQVLRKAFEDKDMLDE